MRRNLSETEAATLMRNLGDLRHLDVDQLNDQATVALESPRTAKIYDRIKEGLTLDMIERIRL
jgi:hypothetical protein